jgi:hypothetical protein
MVWQVEYTTNTRLKFHGHVVSIPPRTWCTLPLPLERQEDVLEPRQVLLASARRLGPRILQLDHRADTLPRRSFRQFVRSRFVELGLFLPITPSSISTAREG